MKTASEKKKILLMGLDNSGKTSILLSLKQDTNLLSFISLKPTKGINIENFEVSDKELSVWDFSGQEIYRDDHLSSFYKYSEKISKLIYVIDIQDVKRYKSALSYFQQIMNLLERDRIIIDIIFFLHKFDPNLKKKPGFENIEDIVDKELVNKIPELIPPEYDIEIFKTSIYTVFEQNLIKKRMKK